METVTFTVEVREKLRKAYEAAESEGVETFTFSGNEYVVGYAKYLLEYLDTALA